MWAPAKGVITSEGPCLQSELIDQLVDAPSVSPFGGRVLGRVVGEGPKHDGIRRYHVVFEDATRGCLAEEEVRANLARQSLLRQSQASLPSLLPRLAQFAPTFSEEAPQAAAAWAPGPPPQTVSRCQSEGPLPPLPGYGAPCCAPAAGCIPFTAGTPVVFPQRQRSSAGFALAVLLVIGALLCLFLATSPVVEPAPLEADLAAAAATLFRDDGGEASAAASLPSFFEASTEAAYMLLSGWGMSTTWRLA